MMLHLAKSWPAPEVRREAFLIAGSFYIRDGEAQVALDK